MAETGCSRAVVCHAAEEWARDDDGDGVREVHVNTMERLWTGLRNFLRPFRGVNQVYLYQYDAIFEWGYNIARVTLGFIRSMLGVPITTFCPP
jgi:transposase